MIGVDTHNNGVMEHEMARTQVALDLSGMGL